MPTTSPAAEIFGAPPVPVPLSAKIRHFGSGSAKAAGRISTDFHGVVPSMNRKRRSDFVVAATCFMLAIASATLYPAKAEAQSVPKYEFDPFWMKLPENWVVGALGGACVDSRDHLYILHRQESLTESHLEGRNMKRGTMAPPVIEFDPNGNLVNHWGDSKVLGEYLHDCNFDTEGNIWIVGARSGFAQKWTRDGKQLLLQIGKSGMFDSSDGTRQGKPLNSNTPQFFGPAGIAIDPANGDIYVADGHGGGNNRIAVLDKHGQFLRQWQLDHSDQKTNPRHVLHCLRMAKDGDIYVCDRYVNRMQVFDKMGKLKRKIDIPWKAFSPANEPLRRFCFSLWRTFPVCSLIDKISVGTSAVSVGFSRDPNERLMYVANQNHREVDIFDRMSGRLVGTIARSDQLFFPGQIYDATQAAVDSKGNVYIAEDEGRRVLRYKVVP
jgi:sugar lactone lactonase YvrE